MNRKLKCFLSASYDTDISMIKSVLSENDIEIFDLYDFSIGSSIQDILKRKLRQADFAIFVITKDSRNVLYEIGVCEGLGKQSLIILDKDADLPFYLENKLSLSANLKNREFLNMTLLGFIEEIKLKKRPAKKTTIKSSELDENYDDNVKEILLSLLEQTRRLRDNGKAFELEYIVEEIFKTLHLKYADNIRKNDIGIDFALWNNKLGKIIGNPIIVEAKFGNLSKDTFNKAEFQIQNYAEKSDAKVALLLYLDRSGKRFNLSPSSSMKPLIIAYDVEDFINDILNSSFENVILANRNKIAHGL